jgi:hypothetical protein
MYYQNKKRDFAQKHEDMLVMIKIVATFHWNTAIISHYYDGNSALNSEELFMAIIITLFEIDSITLLLKCVMEVILPHVTAL